MNTESLKCRKFHHLSEEEKKFSHETLRQIKEN